MTELEKAADRIIWMWYENKIQATTSGSTAELSEAILKLKIARFEEPSCTSNSH